jgi:hypothetical protein
MYAGKTVSYRAILDKQSRDFGFDITPEQGLEWLAEFMAHTNVGMVLETKIEYVPICDGRGDLPADLHKIIQIAHIDGITLIEQAECGEGVLTPMRWATDSFHKRYHRDDRDYTTESRHTYTVGQNVVFPSFSEGFVAISYDAIPIDSEGYPTIPAEQQWLEAATHELAWKAARKRWLKDSLADKKYQQIERDRDWYFAQAVNHAKQWNGVDQAETQKNSHVTTIPKIQDHATFFANMQLPEQRSFRSKTSSVSVEPGKSTQSPSNLA